VLIDSDKGMAEQVAQRIQKGLRNDPREPRLSVSIGIAVYPDDGRTASELIETADRQLYKYKKAENRKARTPQSKRPAR
jgi:diguanylate cyclase (GGDEF)-like protein